MWRQNQSGSLACGVHLEKEEWGHRGSLLLSLRVSHADEPEGRRVALVLGIGERARVGCLSLPSPRNLSWITSVWGLKMYTRFSRVDGLVVAVLFMYGTLFLFWFLWSCVRVCGWAFEER